MRRLIEILGIILLCSVLLPEVCQARDEGDKLTARELLTSTRGYALGNAMVASASGTSAMWHNPAGITSALMASADAAYILDNDIDGHGFETNVVDMKSNRYVGAGLGFMYQYSKPNSISQHLIDVRVSLGVPLADNLISLGVTGAYNYIKLDGKKHLSQFTMDAGLVIRPLEWMALGLSAQNLIVGDYKTIMPRMISAGIMFGSLELGLNAMFEASFNLSADDIAQSGSYGFGLEYVLKKSVPIRLGYRYETDDHHVLTAGLGYRHHEGVFGLDLSYQHHFEEFSNDVFSASLNFYF